MWIFVIPFGPLQSVKKRNEPLSTIGEGGGGTQTFSIKLAKQNILKTLPHKP